MTNTNPAATAELAAPCPFCGGKADRFDPGAIGFGYDQANKYVSCPCGVMGPGGKDETEAIAAWNRRATQASAPSEQPTVTCQLYGHVVSPCAECNLGADADINETNKVLADNYLRLTLTAPTVAAGPSIADDAEFQRLFGDFCYWNKSSAVGHREKARDDLFAHIDALLLAARSPVSGQACEARDAALNDAIAVCNSERVDDTGTDGDTAYNAAIEHCVDGIMALKSPVAAQGKASDAPLTAAQIAAGAAVLTDAGQPIGRNVAIMVADAMGVQGKASDAEDGKRWRFVRSHPKMGAALIKHLMIGNLPLDESVDAAIAARAQQQGQGADHGK